MHELAPIVHRRSLQMDWNAFGDVTVQITVREPLGAMLLKGGRHGDFASFVARELQPVAPESARLHRHAETTWLWQGPREWLVVSEKIEGRALAERFAAKLGTATAAAIDVSDRLFSLELAGRGVLALISKGTSLDTALLSPRACCRTRFAGLHATLFRADESDAYGLIIDRAARVHLHTWLQKVSPLSTC